MNKKDLLILFVPIVIVAIIYPFLPTQIPRQFSFDGDIRYGHKAFTFIFGVIPYLVYKAYQRKKQ